MADGFFDGADFAKVDVFLSYNHGDEAEDDRARRLYERLTAEGFTVAFDQGMQGGDNWQKWIAKNVVAATLVVALWSKRSVKSQWCGYEITLGAWLEKLFPVLLEDLDRGDFPDEVHQATSHIQRISYDAPDLIEQIKAKVTASRAASARRLIADARVHLPEVLASGQPDLFGRDVEESLLADAWASCAPGADPARKTNLVVLHAIGGAGKTALLRRMVDTQSAQGFPHAEKVIGWSAYSQGAGDNRNADADTFIAAALAQMGFLGEAPKDATERGRLLARLMQDKRTLLLLDGIEPLQSLPNVNGGRLKDKGLAALLIALARENPGLVVITSRQPLPETAKLPRVLNHPLDHLRPPAGAALLKHLGCWGAGKDLEAASKEADGHALTLTALGGFIAAVEGGDIRRRDHFRLGEIAFTAEELAAPDETVRAAKKAAGIMQAYIAAFAGLEAGSRGEGAAEAMLLNIVGLFDRPADGAAVRALLAGDPIAGLTDAFAGWSPQKKTARLNAAKTRLRTLKLLAPADAADPDGLDAHPIVRAHFAKALREASPEAHRAAHERLWRHYERACVKDLPDTLEEMQPLFHAIGHACAAGGQQDAFDEIYYRRVLRRNEKYIWSQLGAYAADLGALAAFFDAPWGGVSEKLTRPSSRAAAMNYASFALRALGRLAEAEAPQAAGLELRVAQGDWENAAVDASNLSELRLTLGRVGAAIEAGRQAVAHADRSEDAFQMMGNRTTLADALAQAGQGAEALALFQDAEARQAQRRPQFPRLSSMRGYRYCDLLLDLGRAAAVRERAANILIGDPRQPILDHGLSYLADARALALLAAHGDVAARAAAGPRLDAAVAALRRAGKDDELPRGLLARAGFSIWAFALDRDPAHLKTALEDLDETLDLASRGQMKLFLADHALACARLALAHIPGAPPEALVPLTEEVELTPARRAGLLGKLFGAKDRPAETETRTLSPPQDLSMTRAAPLTAEEHAHHADAEDWLKTAHALVQETGYRRRDRELKDIRRRLDALATLG